MNTLLPLPHWLMLLSLGFALSGLSGVAVAGQKVGQSPWGPPVSWSKSMAP